MKDKDTDSIVLVVDDDAMIREGIQSLTDEEREILQQASKPTKER